MKSVPSFPLGLAALMALAACGTPQQRCIREVSRDLTTLEQLIYTSQGNLERGYAIGTRTDFITTWDWCFPGYAMRDRNGNLIPAPPVMCDRDTAITREYPVAIDLAAERRKLDGMLAKRKQLMERTEPLIAQCRATYPK